MPIARHYVTTGARQIHYRRAGAGPAVVLLHGGLGASATMVPLLERLADRFTMIALDLPGCGASSPLEASAPTIADYAAAVHEAIVALNLREVHLYGKHTGAKIALAVAAGHPDVIRGLTLDVLSLAPAGDVEARLAAYAPAIEPEWHGGHLVRLWHQVRNSGLFFPWYEQTAAARLRRALAPPEWIHGQVADVLCADGDYRLLFAANYGMDARPALRRLSVPATIVVHEGDPNAAEARAMGDLPAGVELRVLAPDGDAEATLAATIAAALSGAGPVAPEPPPAGRVPAGITRDYVETRAGRLHVRRAGDDGARPLVVLHAGPGSTRGLVPLIDQLARTRSVIAFDTLGHGGSDPPPAEPTEIGLYAGAVLEALGRLGIDQADVFGSHTGALIGLEMALEDPRTIRRLVLDGVPLFSSDERDDLLENYIPVLRPVDDGTHLLRLWHMLRDMALFWPWYRHLEQGIRPFAPPDAQGLQRRMVDTLPALGTYHLAYAAAFRYPTRERLPDLRRPALICAGPTDPLGPTLDECGRLAPDAVTVRTPGGTNDRDVLAATVRVYDDFLS